MVVPAAPRSIARARHWAVDRARDAGASPQALASMELVASEVVTNAVRHARGTGEITLRVRASRRDLTVEVEDADPLPPAPQSGRAGLPGGHGLHIVEALASAWGWQPRAAGKVVWFTITW